MRSSRKIRTYDSSYIDNILKSENKSYLPSTYLSPTTIKYFKDYSKLILQSIFIIFIVVSLTFLLLSLSNLQPALLEDIKQKGDEAAIQALEEQFRVNESLWNQFWFAWGDIFSSGMGTSWSSGASVSSEMWPKMAVSIQIGLISFAFSLLIGVPLGVIFGSTKGEIIDWTSAILSAIAFSVPVFVIALIFLVINYSLGVPFVWDKGNIFMYLIPAFVLAIPVAFTYSRYLKTSINLEWSKQYVSFAKVKGARKNRILYKHTFKSAMFPIVTFIPFVFISVFIGSITVESVFAIPGAGSLLIDSVLDGDQPVLLAIVFVYTALVVFAFFIRDLLYDFLDPRIRNK